MAAEGRHCHGTLGRAHVPADVTDLREQASQPLIRADLASIIAIALIKEPSVTAALVRSGCLAAMADPTCAAEDVAARLTDLLSREEVQKASECSELGAQGVSRFMGFASTLRRLGVITPAESEPQRKKPRTASSSRGSRRPEIFHLGAQRRPYTKTGDASTLGRFLNACRANQAAWSLVLTDGSIQSVVEQIDQIMTSVATESQVLQAEGGGYVRKFIARKLLLVCVWEGALDTTRVWSDTSVEQLEGFMPDQTGYLETIPKHWSCEELSQFVFGRGGMVLYVSMYACLWKSVEASTKTREAVSHHRRGHDRRTRVGGRQAGARLVRRDRSPVHAEDDHRPHGPERQAVSRRPLPYLSPLPCHRGNGACRIRPVASRPDSIRRSISVYPTASFATVAPSPGRTSA